MWIDERLKERLQAQDITKNAKRVLDALWKQIVEYVEVAKSMRNLEPQPFTNGTPDEKIVAIPNKNDPHGNRRECRIVLSESKKLIEVKGSVKLSFHLGIHTDGTVGLLDDNSAILTIEEAAQRILDPLIFPDLAQHG